MMEASAHSRERKRREAPAKDRRELDIWGIARIQISKEGA